MNIDTEKEKICINKLAAQKSETIMVESDSIVPDVKPDVMACISTCGNVCIYKKEILEGRIRIDGCVDAYIMYLTDSDESMVRGINTSIDFTHVIDIDRCSSDMSLELNACLNNIKCDVLNGRKISLKAEVEINVKVFENSNEDIIKKIIDIENIQKQNKLININSLVGEGDTNVIIKDSLSVDEGCNLGEILKVNCDITNKEYKTSYNKILAKADFCIKIMYLTEENSIKTMQAKIPVMGFIDIQNVSEENMCDTNYILKNLIVKPNNTDVNLINIEAEIGVDAKAYDTKNIEIIDDIYSPDYNVEFTTKDIETLSEKNSCNQKIFLDENININEMGIKNILDVETEQKINNLNIMNDKIIYEGEVNLKIIFESYNTTNIEVKNLQIPFNAEVNTLQNTNNMNINTSIDILNQSYNMSNDNLQIKLELEINVNLFKISKLRIIDSLNIEEYENRSNSGMTIYFVKPGDTLWNIAKKFRTTYNDICEANDLEDCNKIYAGQQLFIPNYSSNRKRLA